MILSGVHTHRPRPAIPARSGASPLIVVVLDDVADGRGRLDRVTQALNTVCELLRVIDVLGGWALLRNDASTTEKEHASEKVSLIVGPPPVRNQSQREYDVAPDMCDHLGDRRAVKEGRNLF